MERKGTLVTMCLALQDTKHVKGPKRPWIAKALGASVGSRILMEAPMESDTTPVLEAFRTTLQ